MKNNDSQKNDGPIFITGSVRSGTSIMSYGLTDGAGIPGYTEGCFIQLFGGFLDLVNQDISRREKQLFNPKIMCASVDYKEMIKSFTAWFKTEYEKWNLFEGRWVDKTASILMIYSLSGIVEMWPNAKIIFMKRRPIENFISKINKFPSTDFHPLCIQWVKLMEAWESARNDLHPDSFLEIDQYEVATNPDEVAQKVGTFLSLGDEEIFKMADIFKKERIEFTGGDESKIQSLDDVNWTSQQKEFFIKTCGPTAERFGWSLKNSYYI